MTRLTDQQIDEALKACEAATPGPWIADDASGRHIRAEVYRGRKCLDFDASHADIDCFPSLAEVHAWPQKRWNFLDEREATANREFIALARTALPSAPCGPS